ncbi:MAG: PEP-CTERM sorting domain-containing protein [Microcystis aeruginosa DA14]|uniref:PEP-CTERM sorting domain-containing protein n=1 Tax=Microcystis aeruginosa DA14 TaxID=1987506 RepID=A0A3E0MCY4_MICAE|nr:MAG: PEP-CTERM sorting domain-containing protein [Microcystis aeruginosa DA14]
MKIKQLGILSGVFLAATLGTASAAQAALVVVPPGLAPGAQYRLVFVTSGARDGTSDNIDDYNTFVTNQVTGSALANALSGAGLTTTWKAISSTDATSAKVNTGTDGSQPDVPIYLIDSNRVANNNNDLWDGSILTPINRTQLDTITQPVVWTGTETSGIPALCALGSGSGATGDAGSTGEAWLYSDPCVDADDDGDKPLYSLYAMSGVLTVPQNQPQPVTVPEPSSLLGFITLGGLMLGGAVRKARK